jgi:excisionase family DNA binding protein
MRIVSAALRRSQPPHRFTRLSRQRQPVSEVLMLAGRACRAGNVFAGDVLLHTTITRRPERRPSAPQEFDGLELNLRFQLRQHSVCILLYPYLLDKAMDSVPSLPVHDRWLSVEELTGYLGIKRDTIYKWITRRGLPAHKVGRLWKFKREEVDAWVRSGAAHEPDK